MMTNEEIDAILEHCRKWNCAVAWMDVQKFAAQAKLANNYPHLPVEPPGCPTPGACSAVRFVAGAEKGLPNEPVIVHCLRHPTRAVVYNRFSKTDADELIEHIDALKAHAISLAAQLADSAEVEEEYDKVKRVVERSGLEPAPASTMAIKPLHLRVQDLLAQLAEVRGGEQDHIAVVINNNQPGWTNIVETAPNITLDVGTKLFLGEQ